MMASADQLSDMPDPRLGKSPPRLFLDLLFHPTGSGLLPSFRNNHQSDAVATSYPPFNHIHHFLLKSSSQSKENHGVVEAICKKCHTHIAIFSRLQDPQKNMCPSDHSHLHHLHYLEDDYKVKTNTEDFVIFESLSWICCVCSYRITIELFLPVIPAKLVKEEKVSRKKWTLGKKSNNTVFESWSQIIQHIDAVLEGRPEVKNGIKETTLAKKFSAETAKSLMGYMHHFFSEGRFFPPELDEMDPLYATLRDRLEIIQWELKVAAMEGYSLLDDKNSKQPLQELQSAHNAIKIVLGAYTYNKRHASLDQKHTPAYTSLGITSDVADDLVIEAYDRQEQECPNDQYFEYLVEIADRRRTEQMNLHIAKLKSQGRFTSKDLTDAYAALQVPEYIDDDSIIGIFGVRIEDDSKKSRKYIDALILISQSRKSASIDAFLSDQGFSRAGPAAMDSTTAYNLFGVLSNVEDCYLVTLYKSICSEQPSRKDELFQALTVIAEERRSAYLKEELKKNRPSVSFKNSPTQMTLEQAHRKFGVTSQNYVEDILRETVNQTVSDSTLTPSQREEYKKAVRVIYDHTNADWLRMLLDEHEITSPITASNDCPTGLKNIGNTCYFNSLFQVYLTINQFRDIIVNFDQHEDTNLPENKVLTPDLVPKYKILAVKPLMKDLQKLVRELISTDAPSSTPTRQMINLAMKDEIVLPPSPVFSPTQVPSRKSSFRKGGVPMSRDVPSHKFEPLKLSVSPKDKELASDCMEDVINSSLEDKMDIDNPKEVDPLPSPVDLANLPESDTANQSSSAPLQTPSTTTADLFEGSDIEMKSPTANFEGDTYSEVVNMSPKRKRSPPPVPPRPKQQGFRRRSTFNGQQDVHELFDFFLSRIQGTLKPLGHDKKNGQIDSVTQTFQGWTAEYLRDLKKNTQKRKDETPFKCLLPPILHGEHDVYSYLNLHFDPEIVELDGAKDTLKWQTITELPPVLQILIQRSGFDTATQRSIKSDTNLQINKTIYLDRYLDQSGDDAIFRRFTTLEIKEEIEKVENMLKELEDEDVIRGITPTENLNLTKEWAESLDDLVEVDPQIIETFRKASQYIKNEIENLKKKIQDYRSEIDKLFVNMKGHEYRIHSVVMHRGTPTAGHYWVYIHDFQTSNWRKYNDDVVTEVTESQALGSNDGTPYLLTYVEANKAEVITRAVYREMGKQWDNSSSESSNV
ncbi:putative ubiquitin carboxyl-terminal hydrolase 2 [Neolecta irregularis DAH-3]|uniref:ubiquitinyl hydrolase 1 n=1 Tax=Neolecta irregularis (strain DAH-3) TaxID=1198029 RepID=A0A1U7LS67_NEOID|nr:putative ubiquitin carboxyl-terminal hydrolase 2 [Neolecta irregularis DAH-3]|eukprot:OLL25361.1 putative ubiquitin carboxyl-terminal hydrolase 2 [Neolecta irregularis DAH-3]